MNTEMTNSMAIHMHLYKEYEEEQVEGEFMEEYNFTGGKKKNWQEKCERHFRTWLLHSKLIL